MMQFLQLIKICFCHRVNLKNASQSKPVLSYVVEYEGAEEEEESHDSTCNLKISLNEGCTSGKIKHALQKHAEIGRAHV